MSIKLLPAIKIVCFSLLLIVSNLSAFAQGDLFYEEEYLSIYEESDLYIDSYNRRINHYDDYEHYTGGYGAVGALNNAEVVKANPKPNNPAQGTDCVPTLPGTDPDVPINSEIQYLMIMGILFATYKLSRFKRKRIQMILVK